MDAPLIDDLARELGRGLGRRRMIAALFAGVGTAVKSPTLGSPVYCLHCLGT